MGVGHAREMPRRLVAGLESGIITLRPCEQERAPRAVGRGTGPDRPGRAASNEGGTGEYGAGRGDRGAGQKEPSKEAKK